MELVEQLRFIETSYEGHIVRQPVSPYQYSRLSERNNEFRLVRLEPSNDLAAPVCAYLQHRSLLDPPPYLAVSYEVGNPGLYNLILLDGVQVPVSANLFSALHHLRQHGYLLLWIDSICIDQNSDEEKNSQILRIQVIYQEARQVAVWLGPEAHGSWKVMRYMSSTGKSQSRSQRPSFTALKQHDKEIFHELDAFFLRSYWRRVWMIQEIVAGSSVSLFCGWERAEWEDLEELVRRLSKNGHGKVLPMRAVQCLIKFRNDRIEGCSMSMLEILHRSSSSKSTYPKDKIYAMLRLAFDRSTYVSEPKYGWRDNELCMRMTRSFISSKRSLDIIFAAGKSHRSNLQLPSWCPDYTAFPSWSRMRHIVKYVSGQDERSRLGVLGRKWKTTDYTTLTNTLYTINRGMLRVRGAWIATIHDVANVIGEPRIRKVQRGDILDPFRKSDEKQRDAVGRALFLLYNKDYRRQEKYPGIFSHLLYGFDSDDYRQEKLRNTSEFESIKEWREINKYFCIGRWPLKTLSKGEKPKPPEAIPHTSSSSGTLEGVVGHSLVNMFVDKVNQDLERPSIDIYGTLTALSELIDEGLRLMTTWEGYTGWAHPCAEYGDKIYLLAGCSMPVILRSHETVQGAFTVVGHAYVDTMMDGEFWMDCVDRGLYSVDIL